MDRGELYRKTPIDRAALYANMRSLDAFEGVSSKAVELDAATGDRAG